MKISTLVSFLGMTAAFGALAACSSSSSPVLSAAGESCTRTSDCSGGLVCVDQICLKKGDTTQADSGVTSDGGSEASAPAPTRLGQACANTADCGSDLLFCVPTIQGGLQGGLCDLASFGVQPTGMKCGGECAVASDCCELPPNFATSYQLYVSTDGGTTSTPARTCSDLLTQFIGGDATVCATATAGSSQAIACSFFTAYCNGCGTSWTCDANVCNYHGACDTSVPAGFPSYVGACPQSSRTNAPLGVSCIATGTGTAGTCGKTSCKASADCTGKLTADLNQNPATCLGSECSCVNGLCYLSCASDLDCSAGYGCDATTKACKLNGCSSDATCKAQSGNAYEVCNAALGQCVIPCANDHDCGTSSGAVPALGAFKGLVCGTNGYCVSVAGACTNNQDCRSTNNVGAGVNEFCVATPTTGVYSSAITN